MFFAKLWSTIRSRPRDTNMRNAHASASRSPDAKPCRPEGGAHSSEVHPCGWRDSGGARLVRDVEPGDEPPLLDDIGDETPLLVRRIAARRIVRAAVQEDDGPLGHGAEVRAEAGKVEAARLGIPVAVRQERAEL